MISYIRNTRWLGFGLILLSSTLVVAGCTVVEVDDDDSGEETEESSDLNLDEDIVEQPNYTDWGSVISTDHGVDEALVGTWELESEFIGDFKNTFRGRLFSVNATGVYNEDYNNEVVDLEGTLLEGMGESIDVPISGTGTAGSTFDSPRSITDCEVAGITKGELWSILDLNLDTYEAEKDRVELAGGDPDSVVLTTEHLLRVAPLEDIEPPAVDCPSSITGQVVEGEFTTQPLGIGVTVAGQGHDNGTDLVLDLQYVEYIYTIDDSWEKLVINSTRGPEIEWTFKRVSY